MRGKHGKTSKFNNLSVMTGEPYIYFEACTTFRNNTTFVNGLCSPPLHDTGSQHLYLVLFNTVCVNNVNTQKTQPLLDVPYVYSAPHHV